MSWSGWVAAALSVFLGVRVRQGVVRLDPIARFARRLGVDFDPAGHDRPLGLFTTVAKAAFDERLVESGHVRFGIPFRGSEVFKRLNLARVSSFTRCFQAPALSGALDHAKLG